MNRSAATLRSTPGHENGRDTLPWWRYRMVWLVIGGPLAVVVASIVTAVIAHRGADQIVGPNEVQVRVVPGRPDAQTPAMLARNHAQTAQGGPSGAEPAASAAH